LPKCDTSAQKGLSVAPAGVLRTKAGLPGQADAGPLTYRTRS
jgi:hypothetical protein